MFILGTPDARSASNGDPHHCTLLSISSVPPPWPLEYSEGAREKHMSVDTTGGDDSLIASYQLPARKQWTYIPTSGLSFNVQGSKPEMVNSQTAHLKNS